MKTRWIVLLADGLLAARAGVRSAGTGLRQTRSHG